MSPLQFQLKSHMHSHSQGSTLDGKHLVHRRVRRLRGVRVPIMNEKSEPWLSMPQEQIYPRDHGGVKTVRYTLISPSGSLQSGGVSGGCRHHHGGCDNTLCLLAGLVVKITRSTSWQTIRAPEGILCEQGRCPQRHHFDRVARVIPRTMIPKLLLGSPKVAAATSQK